MTYLDEEILRKREEIKKEKYKTLEKGIYLDGKVIKFQRKNLLDTLSVFVPEIMKQMPEDYARVKYPSEFRPQIIISTLDLSVNMGFTVFPNEIQYNDLMKLSQHMRAAVHRSNPDYQMFSCEALQEIQGYWFDFRSHAMDSDLYNMILAVSVGKKLIQGSFNCYYRDYQKWKKIILLIWESIRELNEEE